MNQTKTNEKLLEVLNCVAIMLFTVAVNPKRGYRSGRIDICNDAAVHFIGYSLHEMKRMGFRFFETIIHPDDLNNYMQAIQCLLNNTSVEFCANYRVKPKNSLIYYHLHGICRLTKPEPHDKEYLFVNTMSLITMSEFEAHAHLVELSKVQAQRNYRIMKNCLSKRELEFASYLVSGKTDKEIAQHMNISIYTAKTHRKNIRVKLEKRNTAELIQFLTSGGIVGVN